MCVLSRYVLPKHMLLQIAEVLPKEMQGILACCNPIPTLVKTELLTLHTIIREAREQPLIDVSSVCHLNQLHHFDSSQLYISSSDISKESLKCHNHFYCF